MPGAYLGVGVLVGGVVLGPFLFSKRGTLQDLCCVMLFHAYRLYAFLLIKWESYFRKDSRNDLTIRYYKANLDGPGQTAIYEVNSMLADVMVPSLYDYVVIHKRLGSSTMESIQEKTPASEPAPSHWRVLSARYRGKTVGSAGWYPEDTDLPSLSNYHHAEGDILLGKVWRAHYIPDGVDVVRFELVDNAANMVVVSKAQAIRVLADGYELVEIQ